MISSCCFPDLSHSGRSTNTGHGYEEAISATGLYPILSMRKFCNFHFIYSFIFSSLLQSRNQYWSEPFRYSYYIRCDIANVGYGKFHYRLLALCGWALSSDAIEILCISFVLPSATCELNLSDSDKGWLNSCVFLGGLNGLHMWPDNYV
jgi:hypothetical protein